MVYLWGRDLLDTQKWRYTMCGLNSRFAIKQDMDMRSSVLG